jgi:hypothetical protein
MIIDSMHCSKIFNLGDIYFQDRIEKLWVEAGGRLDTELQYVEETLGSAAGGVNQMVIQTLNGANGGGANGGGGAYDDGESSGDGGGSMLLTPDSLLRHLEVLRRATRVTVQRDDV